MSSDYASRELFGFRWAGIFISAIGIGVTASSIAHFNRVRQKEETKECSAISKSEANVQMWINIILLIMFIILLIWAFGGYGRDNYRNVASHSEFEKGRPGIHSSQLSAVDLF